MTTKEELIQAFEDYLSAVSRHQQAVSNVIHFKETAAKPVPPTQVETIEEWVSHVSRSNDYLRAIRVLEDKEKEAHTERARFEHALVTVLPRQVWFRHGDLGIGIAYTNWGGHSNYVEVKPWQENMPTLNHTYTGD